ncbi:hypothetical protein UVI_02043620 [Ustilaginoidea virens]|uniref:Uncharacterized protein n=1 Tax=Ustilaginoidea virens TaxID=1159556 RepID=A0A1B5L8A0_USTVR|nr:hypothetical protein UVI_02043620 [Ustilaginoidea virens]
MGRLVALHCQELDVDATADKTKDKTKDTKKDKKKDKAMAKWKCHDPAKELTSCLGCVCRGTVCPAAQAAALMARQRLRLRIVPRWFWLKPWLHGNGRWNGEKEIQHAGRAGSKTNEDGCGQ